MILLPVDEAYALDYLSILFTKRFRGLNVDDEVVSVERDLLEQLGFMLEKALNSPEFSELQKANMAIFDAIEKAHRDEIKASEVQAINYRRYLAKKALQARFWPESQLAEKKTDLTKQPLSVER